MTNSKKILVTGGAGYIGSHVCVSLLENRYIPVIVDDLSNSYDDVLDGIKSITGLRPEFYQFDLCNEDLLKKVFETHEISGAIHLAASKAVEESVYNPLKYYKNNLLSLLNLLSVMKEFDVHHFVYSSSASVYALSDKLNLKEGNPTSPVNPYGWTKLMGEQIILDASLGMNLKAGILRYFNPIGAHPSAQIGEHPKENSNNLMSSLGEVLQGHKKEMVIFGNDYDTKDGSAIRDYVHVCDVAEAHVQALETITIKPNSFTVNIGTGQGVSVKEILGVYESINSVKIPVTYGKRRAGDLGYVCADTTLAAQLLNWRSSRTLEDMCKDSHRWITRGK